MPRTDVIVVGGGAAGLFCAIEAAKRGRTVTVLESSDRPGKKIEISGGGRCNFTNLDARPECFLSENPDFCRSALARFGPRDFLALVERRGIAWHEKKLGQLFCDGSARQIVAMLLGGCAEAGVVVETGVSIGEVEKSEDGFRVTTGRGALESRRLVLASGGRSIPKVGASDFAYRTARRFGLSVVPPRPGLVPLVVERELLASLRELAGISFDAEATADGARFRENVLITHRGLSGPAILQVSSYWRAGAEIAIDCLPGERAADLLEAHRTSRMELKTLLAGRWPQRFADAWCRLQVPSRPLQAYSARERSEIAARLHDWRITPRETEGWAKAEVTAGGIDTRELSSKTMESRRVGGLFVIGEAVDVTGWLGGYNFQWAWASGWAAGQAV